MARVQPGGYHTLLRPAPPRGGDDQVDPAEAHRPGHRLALPQRTEEGVEGIAGEVPIEQGVEQAGETVSLLSLTPNEGVQATAPRLIVTKFTLLLPV
jgi:hypothetical protein